MEEEVVEMVIQGNIVETHDSLPVGKIENEFIVLDKGKGKDKRGEKEKEFKKDLSLLELELSKWRHHSILSEKGMISLPEHRRIVKYLKYKWVEELIFQKFQWEYLQKDLK